MPQAPPSTAAITGTAGGAGYRAEYKGERFYRDVRLPCIYEGTSRIRQLIIAGEMLRQATEA
ncbi:MAG TPA: acyl-CoA dehydrogenase family protein [Azospirillaceae bacterium]|nr:acyl-CoA dehydrogenase family protein [Azospirillaceae bacterium]